MAALVKPLPPVPEWWEPASLRVITEEAASAVLACLDGLPSSCCFIGRVSIPAVVDPNVRFQGGLYGEHHIAHRLLPRVQLEKFCAQGIRVGQTLDQCGRSWEYQQRVDANTWSPTQLFACLSTRPVDEATAEVLKFCLEAVSVSWKGDNWRKQDPSSATSAVIATGDALAVDVASGPYATVLAGWGPDVPLDAGFEVKLHPDLEQAARSTSAAQLQQLLETGLGDVGVLARGKVSALHLAALTGHPTVASAVAHRATAAGLGPLPWQDADGRTPLHWAALFDSAELTHALLGVCDATVMDKWGRTALDVAKDLGHHAAAAVLQGRPAALRELSGREFCKMLRSGEASPGMVPSDQLHDLIPLRDYRAWANLAAAGGDVDPSTVLRSMSCFECWYGDVLSRKCSAALPSCWELIRVWDDFASFQSPAATESTPDVAVLAEVQGPRKAPTVADRATFLERFHKRTGRIFEGLDWSNLLVIGGMVLACLIADDEEYARDFHNTDVDIYVVGVGMSADVDAEGGHKEDEGHSRSGAFHNCVSRLMGVLPEAEGAYDRCLSMQGDILGRCDGKTGLEFKRDDANGWLIITGTSGAVAEVGDLFEVGDAITSVNNVPDVDEMVRELNCTPMWGIRRNVMVRPAKAVHLPMSACVVRTPHALTACIRRSSGEALPNVQVVLAPYASPAHLLFTTDIDCTAMGFDGEHLYATPRAREAIRLRQNIARPEKYMVRGEWRTEARLLKYAARGFRVVDLGLQPHVVPAASEEVANAALDAQPYLDSCAEPYVRRVQATGVLGARLLMLAERDANLRRLLLYGQPLLPAGMNWDDVVGLVTEEGNVRLSSYQRRTGAQQDGGESREKLVEYNDGYGAALAKLVMVNPFKPNGDRVMDIYLRSHEIPLEDAIVELDLEADRFQVPGWYDGFRPEDLRGKHAVLDPAVWNGAGDIRRAD